MTTFKIEAGILYFRLNGTPFWEAYAIGVTLCALHLCLIFGFFDMIVRILKKPYLYFLPRWRWLQKVSTLLSARNNHVTERREKMKRWLIKKQYFWFFVLYSLPFLFMLSGAVIATVKISHASSKKGFFAMLGAVPVKVMLTTIIVYTFPDLAQRLLHPVLNLFR